MKAAETEIQAMFRFFNEVAIIAQLSGAAFEKVMPGAMTLSQFAVLNHLARLGGNRTPHQIARAMQVTKGTMTNTIGHLERAGYIIVRPDPADGRAKRVDITDAGRSARQAAIDAMTPELAGIGEAVSPASLAAALPLLEDLRKVLDARRG